MPALVAGIHVFLVAAKTWMAGSSPAMTDMTKLYPLLRCALGSLGKFLHHAVALEFRQIVHKQHAVEMVDLVLAAGSEQALGVFLVHLAVEIGEAKAHLRRPLDLLVIFGNRQAALLIYGGLLR